MTMIELAMIKMANMIKMAGIEIWHVVIEIDDKIQMPM